MTLTVGSLFSGIGGLDLGLERAGMKVIWQSEIDSYANRVLQKHWPEVPNLGNIKDIDWGRVERPTVICGGYPCQPFSQAGHRKGEEDPRHLWPWVRQAISELRPDYAILENVRGHLSLGGTTVIADLAAIGYDAEWRIVSAASVGANHRRDRIIIVAYPNNAGSHRAEINAAETGKPSLSRPWGCGANVAYPNGGDTADGRQCAPVPGQSRSGRDDRGGSDSDSWQVTVRGAGQDSSNVADTTVKFSDERKHGDTKGAAGQRSAIQSSSRRSGSNVADTDTRQTCGRSGCVQPGAGIVFGGDNLRRGTQGYAGWEWWQTEPDVGRVADGIPARVDRLRGLGNAVVPQVAEVIGRLVIEHASHN